MTIKMAVIGANGFIGSRTVEMLHLLNLAEVRPIVRNWASAARLARFALDIRVADAFDQAALTSAMLGCDVALHTVAGDHQTIVDTLAPTYQAAQAAGVRRLIYLSSASVHGQAPAAGTDENTPLSDRQPFQYNNSKVQAERKLQQLRNQGKVELVILRPGIVFGPRSYWIANFAEQLLRREAYLINRGEGICNCIYVDNLVHAIRLAATAAQVDREIYLVGDSERVTWAALYATIANALGFDLSDLPEATPATPALGWAAQAEMIRQLPFVQRFLNWFPLKWRQAAYLALYHLRQPEVGQQAVPSPTTLSLQPAPPQATLEMTLLYQCQTQLPYNKVTRELGYAPLVDFATACQRSVDWLAFAGYPVAKRQLQTGLEINHE